MTALFTLPDQQTLNYINAVACGLIALRIFFWRTTVDIESFTLRLLTYIFIISFADVTIESLSVNPRGASEPETIISVLLCIMCFVNQNWNVSIKSIKKSNNSNFKK